MAIMCYTGVMGSGKTFEAVSVAALNALRQGRRVVTNISGFSFERIREHLGALPDGSMLDAEKVVVVRSSRITEPSFFFDPECEVESVVKPGDLVLIDEVWSFWGTDVKLTPEHQKFFRMHRHYVEAGTGTSCDLVIMIQDLASLHRFIKGVLETSFRFTKLKSLGLGSRYRVEVFEGSKQRKTTLVSFQIKRYDKRIFPLYQSYDADGGREAVVDDRQNLFKNKWFLLVMLAAVVVLLGSGWWFVNYVSSLRSGGDRPAHVSAQTNGEAQKQGAAASAPQLAVQSQQAMVVADLRLVGMVQHATGETTLVIQTGDGRTVRQRMDAGQIDGWQSVGFYGGRLAGFQLGVSKK